MREVTEKGWGVNNRGVQYLSMFILSSVRTNSCLSYLPQSLFAPTCFSYASQYISRYESQGEGTLTLRHHHLNSYSSKQHLSAHLESVGADKWKEILFFFNPLVPHPLGIQWSNSYVSPMAGDTASFGWLCWLMLIDSILYFIIGAYIRTVFPGSPSVGKTLCVKSTNAPGGKCQGSQSGLSLML